MRVARLRIRTLVVLVALVALGMSLARSIAEMRRRSAECAARARHHQRLETAFRNSHATLSQALDEAERKTRRVVTPHGVSTEYLVPVKIEPNSVPGWAVAARYLEPHKYLRDRSKIHWAYHVALRRKYQTAARYPWLPVATDPPESK